MERCLACEADGEQGRFLSDSPGRAGFMSGRRGEVWHFSVGVHVLTRLDGSLKTGSQLWVNLLERC